MTELCERLGCTFEWDRLVRHLPVHFDGEDEIQHAKVCVVCEEEHVDTLRSCGYGLVSVERRAEA